MLKKYIASLVVLSILVLPLFVHAQDPELGGSDQITSANPSTSGSASAASSSADCGVPGTITKLFAYAQCVLTSAVIPFLVGLGVIIFLIGVVNYVSSGDNEEKRESGRDLMIFGIIALFVMVSVWGFVKLLHTSFFADTPFQVNNNSPIK